MRDVLSPDEPEVDLDVVWEVAQEQVPELERHVGAIPRWDDRG